MRLVRYGASVEDIIHEVETIKERVCIYAGLDTLEYLYKGASAGCDVLGSSFDAIIFSKNSSFVISMPSLYTSSPKLMVIGIHVM